MGGWETNVRLFLSSLNVFCFVLGKPKTPHYSLLAATAQSGSSVITVQDTTNWRVRDIIVIACTGDRFSQIENEEHIINAVSDDGSTITLDVRQ